MAVAKVTPVELKLNTLGDDLFGLGVFEAVDDDDGMLIPCSSSEKMLLLFTNTATVEDGPVEVTIHGGDGVFSGIDYTFEIDEGEVKPLMVETGLFKITLGEDKGNIFVEADTDDIAVACIYLP